MSRFEDFVRDFASPRLRVGTFLKTPAIELVELLALSGIDFICIDAEHAPFGRRETDACLAMARAVDLPALVRVAEPAQAPIQQALDSGAVGVLVPHVASAKSASDVARWARFGPDGRGYSGSTRSAGFGTGRSGGDVLVIAQIEDIGGIEEVEAIGTMPGIDALFFGAADLAMAYGVPARDEKIAQARKAIVSACGKSGKRFAFFVKSPVELERMRAAGETGLVVVSSDQSLLLAGARTLVRQVRD